MAAEEAVTGSAQAPGSMEDGLGEAKVLAVAPHLPPQLHGHAQWCVSYAPFQAYFYDHLAPEINVDCLACPDLVC